MVVGGLKMEIGFLVDGLTAMMMCVVTFVSLMVHSTPSATWKKTRVTTGSFRLHLSVHVLDADAGDEQQHAPAVFGWEAVGLVSYLLIGFWFNKPTAIFANMKAFLVNRVGDFGFILGIGLMAAYAGTLELHRGLLPRQSSLADLVCRARLDAGHRDLHLPVHRCNGQIGAVSHCTSGCLIPWKAQRQSPL
jgi:formate hydrogenlyase subunit 3/multisubunit Na+/H+ antiporter MnhD subunit